MTTRVVTTRAKEHQCHGTKRLDTDGLRTCEGDVEAPVRVGVVCEELQSGHMGTSGDGRWQRIPREGAQDRRLGLATVFDGQEVELLLQAEVVEGQVNAALRFGDDQPDAVHAVPVLLGVVG